MKASELMLGDYILVKPSKMPIKIAAVHHKKVAYHACTNRLTWIRESMLEPIPLTLEILEKNGAVYNEELCVYSIQGLILVNHGKEEFDIGSTGYDLWGEVFQYFTTIEYVHQLQHALRLCGIEKEIVV